MDALVHEAMPTPMASSGRSGEMAGQVLGRMMGQLLTSQRPCPRHEQCDSACPDRPPSHESPANPPTDVDRRRQLAAPSRPADQRTEPLSIGPDVPPFRHGPLIRPSLYIRLLKLNQALLRADVVQVELLHVSLAYAPPYGALSYCWGSQPADCKIRCNDGYFMVTSSLDMALRRFRAGFQPGQREEYLWADAICIDQTNLEEKSHQIPLMDRIYSKAQTVYIDLGNTAPSVPADRFALRFKSEPKGGSDSPDSLLTLGPTLNPLPYQMALRAMRQPWFTRTWTIQELLFARQTKFIYEGTVFTQEELESLISRDALRRKPSMMNDILLDGHIARGAFNYMKLQDIRTWRARRNSNAIVLMQHTRDFEATDPKDKIFALLALMSPEDRKQMPPYSSSVQEIYRQFAVMCMYRGHAMDLFDSAGLQRRRLPGGGLPSWAPDWTAQSPIPRIISNFRSVRYAAAGDTLGHLNPLGNTSASLGVRVKGYILDTLDVIADGMLSITRDGPPGAEPDYPSHMIAAHSRIRPVFDAMVRLGESRYHPNHNDAFARCLLMDNTYEGRNAIPTSTPIAHPAVAYREAFDRWRRGRNFRPTGVRMDVAETYQMQASTCCSGRSFATTRDGYMGLVPAVSRPGDEVAVFLGAKVPYVIRAKDGAHGYDLVGDSYIHGFMNGEVLEREDMTLTNIDLT